MKKRILSILLALCMALSLLPTLAFGQETVGQAATEAELTAALADSANDVVRLTADITITAGLKVQHNVTVDLNGCVLRYDEAAAPDSIFRVAGGKTLTMTDSRPAAEHEDTTLPTGGLITGGKGYAHDNGAGWSYYYYGGGVYVDVGASFVLAGGTIYACGGQVRAQDYLVGGGIYCQGGSVTIRGGAIRNCAASGGVSASGGGVHLVSAHITTGGVDRWSPSSFTMTGGVIADCSARVGGGIAAVPCTVQITGGSIENCKASENGGGLYVSGTTEVGQVAVLDAVISGCKAENGGGLYLNGFAQLELRENARITDCTAQSGAAVYTDLNSAYTVITPGCFLYANGGQVDGTVYVGSNWYGTQNGYLNSVKATNAIDHMDGQPSTVFTGDVYCQGDIRGGSFYGSVTVLDPYDDMVSPSEDNLWKICSNLSGGSFYGPVRTECHVSGGTYYADLSLERNAKLSGKPMDTGGVLNDEINTPDPNGKPVTVTYEYGDLGGIYAQQIVQEGETAIRPTDPKVNGFTFCGWYTDENCTDGNEYSFETPVLGNITLYAKWEGTYYGIRITDKDGEVYYVTSENYTDVLGDGTVVYTPGYISKDEIPAEYWNEATNFLTDEAQRKLMDGEEIPGARFPKLTLNGAELQEITADAAWVSNEMQYLCLMLRLELVEKNTISNSEEHGAGIYFPHGLYLIVSGDGSLDVTADYAIWTEGGLFYQRGGEVTLSARRMGIAHSYSHSLQFYGGKLTIQVTSTESKNDYGALSFYSSDETFQIMDGAAFRVGNSAEDNVLITLPSSDEFKPDDIFDQWEGKVTTSKPYYLSLTSNHTVTFDTDGAGAVDTQTVPYGGQVTKPAAPTKTGHTFGGWYLGEEEYDFTARVTANLTLTAKWTVCDHKGSTAHPTCTGAVSCTLCGETLPATGHDYSVNWNLDDSEHWHECVRCGSRSDAVAHTDENKDHKCDTCGVVISAHTGGTATCTDQAVCEVCGERYGDSDAGHHGDLRHVPAQAATTDAEGNIEYWYCGGCHRYYADAAATREITQADTVTAKLPTPVTPPTPPTGDGGAALWITLLLVSGVLAGMAVTKKRKHSKNA